MKTVGFLVAVPPPILLLYLIKMFTPVSCLIPKTYVQSFPILHNAAADGGSRCQGNLVICLSIVISPF